MFSKKLVYLILLAAFSLSACSLKLNEPAATAQSIQLNSSVNSGCLNKAPEVLQQYFIGEASESETADLWDCLIRSLDLFRTNVRGSQGSDFTPNELATFLEYYFLKNKKIPQGLLDELMLLKTVVLGGSSQRVTKDELIKTIEMLRTFKTETLRMRPYMPFEYDTLKKLSPEEFEMALSTFESATQNIARTFERNVRPYNLKNLDRLLSELEIFLSTGSKADLTSWLKTAQRYTKLFRAAKSVFIAPPADEISVNDWKHVFYIVPRYYTLILRGLHYTRTDSLGLEGEGLDRVVSLFISAQQLMTRTVSYHPGRLLKFEEIDIFFDEMDAQKILPIPAPIAKDAMKMVFRHLLTDMPAGEGGMPENRGITLKHMRVLEEQFFLWSEAQYYLQGLYKARNDGLHNGKSLPRDLFAKIPLEESLSYTQLKSDISERAIDEFNHTPRELRSLFPGESRIIMLDGSLGDEYSYKNASNMNWMRATARLVLRGYVTDPVRSRKMNVLTKEELNTFYHDLYPLAVELDFLARSSSLNAANQRFLEADLFSFSGNGDNYLSLNEGLELLSLAVSTIIKGKESHNTIVAHCGSAGKDADDVAMAPLECFRKDFINHVENYLSHTKKFAEFIFKLDSRTPIKEPSSLIKDIAALLGIQTDDLDKLQDAELASLSPRDRVLRNFEIISRGYQPEDKRPVEITHTQSYALMAYYVEALFEKFDADHSGTINLREAEAAYPTFRHFLTIEAAKQGVTKPGDVETLFYFIMKYEKIPETLQEKLLFKWKTIRRKWYFETNRAQVLTIFAALLSANKAQ